MMRMPPSSSPPPIDFYFATPFKGMRSSSVGPDHIYVSRRRLASLPPEGDAAEADSDAASDSVDAGRTGTTNRRNALQRPYSVAGMLDAKSGAIDAVNLIRGADETGNDVVTFEETKRKTTVISPTSPKNEVAMNQRPPRSFVLTTSSSSSSSSSKQRPASVHRESTSVHRESASVGRELSASALRSETGTSAAEQSGDAPAPMAEMEFPEMILLSMSSSSSSTSSSRDPGSSARSGSIFDNNNQKLTRSCSSIEQRRSTGMPDAKTGPEAASGFAHADFSGADFQNGGVPPSPATPAPSDAPSPELSLADQSRRLAALMTAGVVALRAGVAAREAQQQRGALTEMQAAVQGARGAQRFASQLRETVSDALREAGGLELLVARLQEKREELERLKQKRRALLQRQEEFGIEGDEEPKEKQQELQEEQQSDSSPELRLASASVLSETLSARNRDHVVSFGLEGPIVRFAVVPGDVGVARVGTGLLAQLFRHSEDSCRRVIKSGGLDAIVGRCGSNDAETLRQCAIAFANLALFGGEEGRNKMIQQNVPAWLFPLAFSTDPLTKYFACLAIAALASTKEFEATVRRSGTLDLVAPFAARNDPADFAAAHLAVEWPEGRSVAWLERLLPVLESSNEAAQTLAAFHFAAEAFLKNHAGKLDDLRSIGTVAALKRVASRPNDAASKLAAAALKTLGEDVPRRLAQQVPLWSRQDVAHWVERVVDFPDFASRFFQSGVDGDLLLRITDEHLRDDIGMTNGLHRRLFMRRLTALKRRCDYSCCDFGRMFKWLARMRTPMTQYTYDFVHNGVSRFDLRLLSDSELKNELNISNAVHRKMILDEISTREALPSEIGSNGNKSTVGKTIDAFISYRRSNGSQLASLLKVHLQLRNFSVFLDVEKLEAGKFDENLLISVRSAKNFLLVLSSNALDRCMGDEDQNDWVHKEIFTALESGCNIIPITDNFSWPTPERLPVDIQKICRYNGIKWIHDYQDACVAKIVRFIKGETAPSVVSAISSVASEPIT